MAQILKSSFTLEELAGEWGLCGADLRYVAENGLLKLSVRVIGNFMEFGIWEEADEGEPPMSIPCEHRYHDGLGNLCKRDVFTLLRDGIVEATHFLHGDRYASLLRDEDVVAVRPRDLLVRGDERRRFEAEVLPTLRTEATDFGDFSDFWHDRRRTDSHRRKPSAPGSPARRCLPRSARTRSSSATSSSGGRSGGTWSRRTAVASIGSRSR